LKSGDYTGINVTIPYKKSVIPYLQELSPVAQKMGAVNTIVRRPDGTLYGHNTDCFGFMSTVKRSGLDVSGKKVLILGSGGASNTATAAIEELGAKAIVISRSGENNYTNLNKYSDAAVIVNATPVGMYPDNDHSPVDLDLFPCLEGVLDLIYNPARTRLLQDAEKRGIIHQNGLWMLVAQAKEAAELFTGKSLPDAIIEDIYKKLSIQMQNIVLIGMPGSGKSTIGKLLAEQTGRVFADADELIVSLAGKSIPEVFRDDGEAVFRQLETKALAQLGKHSGLVIATGGGCVTRQRNYSLLRQNGMVFWLNRELNSLPTDGRPLSQSMRLKDMYEVRKPMYESFADHRVDNNGNLVNTVDSIISLLEDTL